MDVLDRGGDGGTEKLVEILYQPQAKFRVQSVTHCTSSIPGQYGKKDEKKMCLDCVLVHSVTI